MPTPRRIFATVAAAAAIACLTLAVPRDVVSAAPPARAPGAPAAGAADVPKDDVVVDERTEQTIRGALKWLASKQQPNGSWNTGRGNEHPVAMTGYTLMAFMAAGQLPG